MSLKIRLVLILSAVLSIGIALGAAVLLLHARAAMRSEMDTALRSAERLISAVRSQPGLASLRPEDLTESLDRLRHVRVIRPGAGPLPPRNMHVAGVPRWFSRLIAPATEGLESINLTVGDLTVGGAHEQVILQADPSDEIREVWQDVRVIMVIAAAMCLCVGGLVYLGLARGLRPLADLEAAFDRLECRRLREPVYPEACGAGTPSHPQTLQPHGRSVVLDARPRARTRKPPRSISRRPSDAVSPKSYTMIWRPFSLPFPFISRPSRVTCKAGNTAAIPEAARGQRAYRRRASGAHPRDAPATAAPGSRRAGPRSGATRSGRDLAIPPGPYGLGDRDVRTDGMISMIPCASRSTGSSRNA